jgi:two-component system phosphoglycerate transport system response regulator PgtA
MESNEPSHLAGPDRILIAEDDDSMRNLLVAWLHEAGYDVTACRNGFDLLVHLERSVLSGELPEFDLVVSDIPLGSALDVLDEFSGCDGVPPTILITAFGDRRANAVVGHEGVATVLQKPLEKGRLMAEIQGLRARDTGAANVAVRIDPRVPAHHGEHIPHG